MKSHKKKNVLSKTAKAAKPKILETLDFEYCAGRCRYGFSCCSGHASPDKYE